jgi:ketosteroid isomerase-like protein
VHDILATDDHVVNLDRMTATRGEKKLDQDLILVVHPRDGKIAEAWDRFSDQYAWDDFWA